MPYILKRKNMNIEQLKDMWQQQEQQLASSLKLNATLLRKLNFDQAERKLRRLLQTERLNILGNLLFAAYLLAASTAVFPHWPFSVPGYLCAICCFLLAGFSIIRIRKIKRLDYIGSNILELQKQLADLVQTRLRLGKRELWVSILALVFMWPVVLYTGWSLNIYQHWTWLLIILAGVAVIVVPVAIWHERSYRTSLEHSQQLLQEIADLEAEDLSNAMPPSQ